MARHSDPKKKTAHLKQAVLAVMYRPNEELAEVEASLAELQRLVETLGYKVIGTVKQKRLKPSAPSMFGEGKLPELAYWTGGSGLTKRMSEELERDEERVEKFSEKVRKKKKDYRAEEYLAIEAEKAEAARAEAGEEDSAEAGDNTLAGKKPLKEHERADLIVFDNNLSPSQVGNLEHATDVQVLDRSGVIIQIFARHAQTKEAKLQVEIAQLKYMAPRLRESRVGDDHAGGGTGGRGDGESAAEMDSRRVRHRLSELTKQLKDLARNEKTQKSSRDGASKVALVGYTNAGKSSLMRALTQSEKVYVADKLFATLDTTVRSLQPETSPRILVSDTVGFIKKLPHDLVASFRSTLAEAKDADLLLHIIDGSDPMWSEQLKVTKDVLADLGVNEKDQVQWTIFNKSDKLTADDVREIKAAFPKALFLSALAKDDVKNLAAKIREQFGVKMKWEE